MSEAYHGGRPYEPLPVPYDAEALPRYIESELQRLANILADLGKVAWGGSHELGDCYDKGAMVQDDGWTMVANKDTCDRPSPQPVGISSWTLPDTPTWENLNQEASTLHTGHRYTYPVSGYLNGIRAWLPVASENTFYQILLVKDPDGLNPEYSILLDWFNATTAGWNILGANQRVILKDSPFDLILATQNRTGLSQFAGNYNYSTPGNDTVPLAGQITQSNQFPGSMYVHKTDADGNGLPIALGALKAGDLVAGAGMEWTIQSNTTVADYFILEVIPALQGGDGLGPFNFTNYASQPIPYVQITDHWVSNASIQGYFDTDAVAPPTINNDAYGIDINFQEADVSDDWDLVSAP